MGQHKCENCGKLITWKSRIERGKVAKGWVGTGGAQSKYGKEFDKRRGMKWWCTDEACIQARLKNDVVTLFPNAPKRLVAQYGRRLVRVRYHNDVKARKAFTTVELVVPGSERFYDPRGGKYWKERGV